MFPAALGLALLLATSPADAPLSPRGKPLLSPDGLLEIYSTPAWSAPDANGHAEFYGEKVYLRVHGSTAQGVFLLGNDRWFYAEWAPHSHFIGFENHWDGHASDVYVYEAIPDPATRTLHIRCVFQSPDNGYDVHWSIEGWDVAHRTIRLRREEILLDHDAAGNAHVSGHGKTVTTHRSFPISTIPLSLPDAAKYH